jgi:hypothetical protein
VRLVPADKAAEVQSVITNYAISQLPLDTDFSILTIFYKILKNIYIQIQIKEEKRKKEQKEKGMLNTSACSG